MLISRSIYSSNFFNLCKWSKILNPVKIFAYQQEFQVYLRFVNEMLCAECYRIDFMGKKNKLKYKTFLEFQNECISTFFIYLQSLYIYIKCDRDFKITHFTSVFNAKKKGFELRRLHYSSRGLHKKSYAYPKKPEDTLKSGTF